jgi:uncharacterized membrane protein YraQ (UPF0718 family)
LSYLTLWLESLLQLFSQILPWLIGALPVALLAERWAGLPFWSSRLQGHGVAPIHWALLYAFISPPSARQSLDTAAWLQRTGATRATLLVSLITLPASGIVVTAISLALLGAHFTLLLLGVTLWAGVIGGLLMRYAPHPPHSEESVVVIRSFRAPAQPDWRALIVRQGKTTLPPLLAGLMIAALLQILLPGDLLAPWGGDRWLLFLLLPLLALSLPPLLLLPLIALLVSLGLSLGAALLLYIVATSIGWGAWRYIGRELGRHAIIAALITLLSSALLFASLVNLFLAAA